MTDERAPTHNNEFGNQGSRAVGLKFCFGQPQAHLWCG
jgi:hypothetical protein